MESKLINDDLVSLGYSLAYHCTSPGDYETPSEWQVTLSRGGQSLSSTYTKGCAHRCWKKGALRGHGDAPTKTYSERLSVHRAEQLRNGTEPIPPTLDEVMYALQSDASNVRFGQTFDEFCSDFGLDTDSRRAESSFNACRETWAGLTRLGADFDALAVMFQDY